MENKIIVLGAGIAGISAAYHAQQKYPHTQVKVFEKTNDWGGLCGGFYIKSDLGDFWFDHMVHLSFASNSYVQNTFHTSSKPIRHIPTPTNYYNNIWLKHPAQNNLYPLSTQEKVIALKDMIDNKNKKENLNNFEEWLRAQYGNYFTENFPLKYTRKYWSTEAKDLSTSWVSNRLYTPSLEEILQGAMSEQTPNTYYAQEMRYPESGQYRSFFKNLKDQINIIYNKEVCMIDTQEKSIFFSDGTKESYDHLISTIPITDMANLVDKAPQEVIHAAQNLKATSTAIISLGFKRNDIAKNLWFYIYDEDKLFARVYSPSFKSPNNAPNGCSSLQAEIYFSDLKPLKNMINNQDAKTYLLNHTIEKFIQMGICKKEDIICQDFRILPYANVIFMHNMESHRSIVLKYLIDKKIISCGRFGEWDYLWSDQSFLSGKNAIEKIDL